MRVVEQIASDELCVDVRHGGEGEQNYIDETALVADRTPPMPS